MDPLHFRNVTISTWNCEDADVAAPILTDGRKRGGGADPLRPIGAADEAVLRGLHHFAATNDGRHRLAVGDGFRKDSNIGYYAVMQMSPSRVHAPSGGHFIEHRNRAGAVSQLTDAFEKAGVGLVTANRLRAKCRLVNPSGLCAMCRFFYMSFRKS
jgi:hypothetical protein